MITIVYILSGYSVNQRRFAPLGCYIIGMAIGMADDREIFEASAGDVGQRLDIFCVRRMRELSRSAIQKAVKSGDITVNGEQAKPRYVVREGDIVRARLRDKPPAAPPAPPPSLPVIYEDKDVVAVDKPPFVAVQPGVAQETGTAADWLEGRLPDHTGGLAHRLDRGTSGVLLMAKNKEALEYLRKQFQKRRVKKEYLALVFGAPKAKEGRVSRALARSSRYPLRRTVNPSGKPAVTEWRLERKLGGRFALLKVFPLTGRTHQIRVHLHFIGHPVVGDPLYTFKRRHSPSGVTRQLLHAQKLTAVMPSGKRKTITAGLSRDFQDVLSGLE